MYRVGWTRKSLSYFHEGRTVSGVVGGGSCAMPRIAFVPADRFPSWYERRLRTIGQSKTWPEGVRGFLVSQHRLRRRRRVFRVPVDVGTSVCPRRSPRYSTPLRHSSNPPYNQREGGYTRIGLPGNVYNGGDTYIPISRVGGTPPRWGRPSSVSCACLLCSPRHVSN